VLLRQEIARLEGEKSALLEHIEQADIDRDTLATLVQSAEDRCEPCAHVRVCVFMYVGVYLCVCVCVCVCLYVYVYHDTLCYARSICRR